MTDDEHNERAVFWRRAIVFTCGGIYVVTLGAYYVTCWP